MPFTPAQTASLLAQKGIGTTVLQRLQQMGLDDVGALATSLEYHSPKIPGLGDVEWGKFVSALTGPSYTAAKHAVGALTLSLNTEECVNGIRGCAIFPGEVATPMLQSRAVMPSAEEQARMLQPDQVAAAVRFVAEMPEGACVNEILMSPTWNRSFAAVAKAEAELKN